MKLMVEPLATVESAAGLSLHCVEVELVETVFGLAC